MQEIIKKLEEQIAFLQQEMIQISDEVYSQQKEISKLTHELLFVKNKLHAFENNSELREIEDEAPPPHY